MARDWMALLHEGLLRMRGLHAPAMLRLKTANAPEVVLGLDLSPLSDAGADFHQDGGDVILQSAPEHQVRLSPPGARRRGRRFRPDLWRADGDAAVLMRISARLSLPLKGRVSLILCWLDADGRLVDRTTLSLGRARKDCFLSPPLGARGLAPRLAITGADVVSPLSIEVETFEADRLDGVPLPPAGDKAVNATSIVHQAVRAMHLRGDHQAVVDLHGLPVMRSDMIAKLAFFSLVELREFERAVAFHARHAPPGAFADEWERRLLESLGNLGRWEAARDRVARLTQRHDVPAGALAQGFAFTSGNAALRGRVIETLVAHEALPVGEEAALIDVANRCLFMPEHPLSERLFERVREHPELPGVEAAMLDSQRALVRGDFVGQLHSLNGVFRASGLDAVAADCDQPLGLSRLRPGAPAGGVDGPLVSVIMTAFNSAPDIAYALNALFDQSYANIEIILIDDASTDATVAEARRAAAGRPLTILRRDRNGGTYACRNMGLARARGVYVANQDSDDWAHPQKIERLVGEISRGSAVGVQARGLRLTPSHGFLSRGGFVQLDGSSLLFHRQKVIDRMGGYEMVRTGADGEFLRRMVRCFGADAVTELSAPLSVIAARPGSLSRSGASFIDPETGVFTEERNGYRQDYLRRHEAGAQGWMRPLEPGRLEDAA